MIFLMLLTIMMLYYVFLYYAMIKPRQVALEESNRKLGLLYELSVGFHESISLENSLEKILDRLISIVNADAASLFMLDERRERFNCPVAVGPTADEIVKISIPYGEGIVSNVEKTKKSALINDMSSEKSHFKGVDEKLKYETRSMICVPLFASGSYIGAIQVVNKKGGDRFDESDLTLLDTIANLTAVAINNASAMKALRKK